jgi:hypothetical protein
MDKSDQTSQPNHEHFDHHALRQNALEASTSSGDQLFTDETIIALRDLGRILEPIYRRLKARGDGRLSSNGNKSIDEHEQREN